MQANKIHFSCLLLTAMLCANIRCAPARADAANSPPAFLSQGLVVAIFHSAVSDSTNQHEGVINYEVQAVLRPIPGDDQLAPKSIVPEFVPPNESRLPFEMQMNNFPKSEVIVAEVVKTNGAFQLTHSWAIASHPLEQIIPIEKSGVQDIAQIEQQPGEEAQISTFVATARSTKTPSLLLDLEALRLVKPSTTDAGRMQLVRGLMAILSRSDAPDYARASAFRTTAGLYVASAELERARQSFIASTTMTTFHALWQSDTLPQLQCDLLIGLPPYLRGSVSDPALKDAVKQFTLDLPAYEKKRLSQTSGTVTIIPQNNADGSQSQYYTYEGTGDKMQTEMIVRPLFDILGEVTRKPTTF